MSAQRAASLSTRSSSASVAASAREYSAEDEPWLWTNPYMTAWMRRQIANTTTIAASELSGRGQFARRSLRRGAVVGYYSGRILNAHTWSSANPHYIAQGRWTHPERGRAYTHYFEVMTPSRYMNGGISSRYLERPEHHPMAANAELISTPFRVAGRYRLVFTLRTTRDVKAGCELLVDYGVLYDSLYFEFLRQNGRREGNTQEHVFDHALNREYARWRVATSGRTRQGLERYDKAFLQCFAKAYFDGKSTIDL